MKRNFFQIFFNIGLYLFSTIILLFLFEYGLLLAINLVNDQHLSESFTFLITWKIYFIKSVKYIVLIREILLIISFILLCLELGLRVLNDSILNLFISIYQTIQLRIFLKLHDKSKEIQNPIYEIFNYVSQKSSVNIRKNSVQVCVKMPRNQQAQKILKTMELDILAEISFMNPQYYFSDPIRKKHTIWIIGSKR